ncbi:16S ribosomal RNA methyltransferase RsmE [Nitzschia inconspicua]|uniref:16S ribosomal RNA methyltransferase RsmE n=1 Tax=Nitzschia inconspicua TaxID=303405 RepID=A0A9K3KW21_9STRA|nr:16S ribosomal RNA methyltransferase RsmE [Nitzschia inconspicua]
MAFAIPKAPLRIHLMNQLHRCHASHQVYGDPTSWKKKCSKRRMLTTAMALYCFHRIPSSLTSSEILFPSADAFSVTFYLGQRDDRRVNAGRFWHKDGTPVHLIGKRFFATAAYSSSSSSDHSNTSKDGATIASVPPLESTRHLPRLYVEVPHKSLKVNALVPITRAQSHYLLDVMRITNPKRWQDFAGHVRIFNGHDGEWLAKTIETIGETSLKQSSRRRQRKSEAGDESDTVLECLECLIPQSSADDDNNNNSRRKISVQLYLGRLKKKQQRKWVLEKVTELGVDGITLLDTEYSTGSGGDPWDHEKHQAHVIEAAEQCERLTLPSLSPQPLPWEDLLDRINASTNGNGAIQHIWLVCRERCVDSPPILSVLHNMQEVYAAKDDVREVRYHLLVGPEGGWSPNELEIVSDLVTNAVQQPKPETPIVQFVSLGSLVLRAETAAITATAIVGLATQ